MTQNAKNTNECFVQNNQKTDMEIFVFCAMTFEPIKIKTH